MFERFTDRARRAVVLAQEQARSLNHNYIGTEHLLLGLLAEGEGVAARALRELGADIETLRSQVLDQVGPGGPAPDDHIPFTPPAKKTMEFSLREALKLGHNYIGTEHLLLGLLRETDGMASQVLTAMDIDLSEARIKVVELLSGMGASATSSPMHGLSTPSPTARRSPALEAALAQAASLAGDDLVGTHHVLAALTMMDNAAAPQILAAGGFDASSLEAEMIAWEVRGTGDEDPVDRAARGTVVIQDASGMTIRLDDAKLRERIERALSTGRINEDQLREAFGRVWAEFAAGGDDVNEQDIDRTDPEEPAGG